MGNKSKSVKRKAGHVGLQASEIAFIEDEMVAFAAEYGLEVDGDVAGNVGRRQASKKTRRRRVAGNGFKSNRSTASEQASPCAATRIHLVDATSESSDSEETNDAQTVIRKRLADVLPATCALQACGVPGCACKSTGQSFGFQVQNGRQESTKVDVIERWQCLECHHGVLQHTVGRRPDVDAWPRGGQRLFQTLYEMIRLGRIGATIFHSRIWTHSVLEQLDALVVHLKHHVVHRGRSNGQTAAKEVQHEKLLLAQIQPQLRKAQEAVKTASRDELPIRLACALDQLYFPTYYAALVLYGRASRAVPSPDVYFQDLERFCPASREQLETFLNCELANSKLLPALALPLASSSTKEQPGVAHAHERDNPLLTIYHARLREGVRLFYDHGIGMQGEMDAALVGNHGIASKKHLKSKPTAPTTSDSGLVDMPCYPLLQAWRDNCRDWCCHLYAYATPTPQALDLVAKYAPIVEMGAGTGYWAALLQQRKVDIVAYDHAPPGPDRVRANAYHGHVPGFCSVTVGTPSVLLHDTTRSLLLCYPPPHDPLAATSLECFQGHVVLYVGEWQGDTADARFERTLAREFTLQEHLALPNWGNSAYSLTVWRRKDEHKSIHALPSPVARCGSCHTTTHLRRCRLCKTNVYCSWECARADEVAHEAEHALRLVFLRERVVKSKFHNDRYYRAVRAYD
ncbi:hypothetical protein PsorP6_010979 [Peronosclerospora sorghi]|uniref:Uncharacterized protein n=1 Tax=Peronosclerospora sorghi TaxID=230839 RepID=A0ACC0VVN3_9STRA|nr:hypothetical protein PsorP6_010979 [Peronosclerospora sorghi]